MLTDDQARTLLNAAADTIDVPPARPIPLPPRRPAWVPGLAIAAVLAVVAGVLAVAFDGRRNHADDRISPIGPAPAATRPWPAPSDPDLFQLAPDQMPSLFGYTAAAATALLESHGFKIRVLRLPECDSDGRVFDSLPNVGSMLRHGQRITIDVGSYREKPNCSGDTVMTVGATPGSTTLRQQKLAYDFLDWIDGRGPAPEFAHNVSAQLGATTSSFSGGAASLLASWGDDFEQIRDASHEVSVEPSLRPYLYLTPHLSLGVVSANGLAENSTGTTLLDVWIEPAFSTVSSVAAFTLSLDAHQRIVGVQVESPSQTAGTPTEPQVVGDPTAFAKQRLTENGYTVSTSGCTARAIVAKADLQGHLATLTCHG